MKTEMIKLNYNYIKPFINETEFDNLQPEILKAHQLLMSRTGAGNDFLGWLDLPYTNVSLINQIQQLADKINERADYFVCIGIGGSYLGARAVIEALQPQYLNKIQYLGHNLDAVHLNNTLESLKGKDFWVNVISKSGTTLEPAVAFRIVKNFMEQSMGKEKARQRIIATTDKQRGALKKLATAEGYPTFIIPDDVGGRFSVLTPVGLIPIAVAGVDIKELLAGARDMAEAINTPDLSENIAYQYAAIRTLLYRKGKVVEVLANFTMSLHYFAEWWKQLYGESEGKEGKGIFPAAVDLTTDLHSLGQYIQDGIRNIFETFLIVKNSGNNITVPFDAENFDGLNYLAHKTIAEINEKAYQGTALAHQSGKVPNLTIELPQLSVYTLGQLIFFFEKAVAMSGYILGVNPFNQPGVEEYKINMFRLLGKSI
jgi:glucose-6-phosphate isomerase